MDTSEAITRPTGVRVYAIRHRRHIARAPFFFSSFFFLQKWFVWLSMSVHSKITCGDAAHIRIQIKWYVIVISLLKINIYTIYIVVYNIYVYSTHYMFIMVGRLVGRLSLYLRFERLQEDQFIHCIEKTWKHHVPGPPISIQLWTAAKSLGTGFGYPG